MLKKLLFPAFILLSLTTFSQKQDTLYIPQIEGTIRAKYEYNPSIGKSRFEVRNARFSINGKISPITLYKAEIDLSDEGITKMLDAYVKILPKKCWNFTIGQQKVPFSTDNLRSPHQLYFANHSFIGKQLTALRDVGATLDLKNKTKIPFDLIIGVYNGTGLYNQKSWRKTDEFSLVSRFVCKPAKNINISLNANTIKPVQLRMNLFDAGFSTDLKEWHFESEYLYKTYNCDSISATEGFFAFAAYNIQIHNKKNLSKVTPVLRYDMMTDNICFDDKGNIRNDIKRSRLTGGLTFSLNKPFLNDIRLNYEQYFYKINQTNSDNKLVIEFVARF